MPEDSVDLGLLYRFRDEIMKPTPDGDRYVDHYYTTTPEILKTVVLVEPDVAPRAVRLIEQLQPSIRSVLDGDGAMPIMQTQMERLAVFLADLSTAGSESVRQLIADELDRIGPLDDFVGLPVGDVLRAVLGESTGTAIEGEIDAAPTDFLLAQNYPNPFNPATTITYTVPQAADVTLTVIDVLGRAIRVVASGTQPAGTYDASFDATGLPSGVHFYRLEAGDYSETKRMVVVR